MSDKGPFPCWRQHLNSADEDCVTPLAFELPTPSTSLCDVTKENVFWSTEMNLLSILISRIGPETETERRMERGEEKEAVGESLTAPHSPINHPVYTTHYLAGGPLF